MKTITFISLLIIFGSFAVPPEDILYYCASPYAKRYHKSKDCKGLEKCTHTIERIIIEKASNLGITVCQLEK